MKLILNKHLLHKIVSKLAIAAMLNLSVSCSTIATESSIEGMQLLKNYNHQAMQGIDSKVGVISKKGGLNIKYELGRVATDSNIRKGGDFTDRAKRAAKGAQWYREQVINGQVVHLAHLKNGKLLASFPLKGMNFSVDIKKPTDLADALLMILSYPGIQTADR